MEKRKDIDLTLSIPFKLWLQLESIAQKYNMSINKLINECIIESLSDEIYDATHPED